MHLSAINILKWRLALLCNITTTFVYSQSYTITPKDSIVAFASFNKLTHFNIQQNNQSGRTLILNWKRIAVSIPTGWAANLCDNAHCFTDFPESGTMDSVFNTEYGLLAVGINPDTIQGTAWVQYEVWDLNYPNNKDTLTWIISSNNITGINKVEFHNYNLPGVYPNPASDFFYINTGMQSGFEFLIIDMYGKEIQKGVNELNGKEEVSSVNLANGVYQIIISKNKKPVSTTRINIQH